MAELHIPDAEFERAKAYVAIFVNVGDRWRDYVPVDGQVSGDAVTIGSATVTRQDGGAWKIQVPGHPTALLRARADAIEAAR